MHIFGKLLAIAFLMNLILASCTHAPQKTAAADAPVIYTNVTTPPGVRASLENWESRIRALESESNTVVSKDRYQLLDRKVSNMKARLRDVRHEFFEYRTSDPDNRQARINQINEYLNQLLEEYRTIPAE